MILRRLGSFCTAENPTIYMNFVDNEKNVL